MVYIRVVVWEVSLVSLSYKGGVMIKKAAVGVIIAVFLTFSSCDDFFRTSWGNPRTYDPSKIDISADDIDKWIAAAVGNPELAKALSQAIIRELKQTNDPVKKSKLLEGGIKIAVEASGVGTSIISSAAGALSGLNSDNNSDENIDVLIDVFKNIQDNFNSGNGPDAANAIAQMVFSSIGYDETEGGKLPRFDSAFVDIAEPGDAAEAVMVLLLGLMNDQDLTVDSTVEDWKQVNNLAEELFITEDKNHVGCYNVIYEGDDINALALAAYLNLISENTASGKWDNPLTGGIFDLYLPDHDSF